MTSRDDRNLKQWTDDWQAAPYDVESAEQIGHYVKQRTGLLWSFAIADFVIGGLAVPVLVYRGVTSPSGAERFAMWSLAWITVAAIIFGWWNRRGVLRARATTVAEYVAISAERLRRMRLALRIGWFLLVAQDIAFSFWIWNRVYSGAQAFSIDAERFAWSWLAGMTIAAVIGMLYFGRWIRRDEERFEALRRELGTG